MNPARRNGALAAAAFAVLHVVIGLALLTPAPYHGGDNASYLALAWSLLDGGYTEVWDPAQRGATLYPPLFPLLLAGSIAAGMESWIELKMVCLVVSAAAVAVSVLWLNRVRGAYVAVAGGAVLALSPGVLEQAGYVLSEGLFWLFTMLAFMALTHVDTRSAANADGPDARLKWIALAAAAAAAAGLTRSAGLPLVAAVISVLLLRRRWREVALFAAISVPPLLAWSLRGRIVGQRGYGSYLTMVDPYNAALGSIGPGDLVVRIAGNLGAYIGRMAPSVVWGAETAPRSLMVLLVLAAAGWAVVRLIGKPDVLEIWLFLYAALLLAWPESWAGERFVLAVLPALVFLLADMLQTLRERSGAAGLVVTVATLTFALGLMPRVLALRISSATACRALGSVDRFACMPPGFGDFMHIADRARTELPAEAVVISRKPTLFFTASGRPSAMYPLSPDTARFFALADSVDAEYVVVEGLTELSDRYLIPVLQRASHRFCAMPAMQREGAAMLRITREAAPAPASPDSGTVLRECAP